MKSYDYKEFELNYQNFDYKEQLRISNLLNNFTDIATTHANKINLWSPELNRKYGWVVSKIHLEVLNPSKVDKFTLKTYIGKPSKVIFPRYYEVYQDEQLIVKASSIWTLLDLTKRSITLPSRAGLSMPDCELLEPSVSLPSSIEDKEYEYKSSHKVLYSDIDLNQHLNNARYVDIACDLIPLEVFENHHIHTLDINFIHEVLPLQELKLYLANDENTYYIQGYVEDTKCFVCKISFN